MKHLDACPWLAGLAPGCSCAEETYLASCSPEEAAEYEARNAQSTVARNHLLNVSETHWRRA